jgi:hypothetical protein
MTELTQERLKEFLAYDESTGSFTWIKKKSKKTVIGKQAGYKTPDGHISINFDKKKIYAHRLVYLYLYGSLPAFDIDHINCDPSDNRKCNLREVTNAQNKQNITKPTKRNKTGFLGVKKYGNRWQTRLSVNGKCTYVGTFHSPEEAHNAYVAAKKIHHPFSTF